MNKKTILPILISILTLGFVTNTKAQQSELWSSGNSLIPYPQKVNIDGRKIQIGGSGNPVY